MATLNSSCYNTTTAITERFTAKQNIYKRNTLILVPCGFGIDHKTDENLRILESYGYQVWRQPGYSAIDQCRNKMIYNFLQYTNFKNILWIDGDIIFNIRDVQKLENSGFDIVGGTYPFKGYPQMTFVPKDNKKILFGDKGPRFVEVEALATGFLFVTRSAIKDIISKLEIPLCNTSFDNPSYPLFTPSVLTDNVYVGEDFGFCAKAKKCGYKLYLDTTIHLKHVGRYEYSWSDVVNKLPVNEELEYNINQPDLVETRAEKTKPVPNLKKVAIDSEVDYNINIESKKSLFTRILDFLKRLFK